MIDDFDDHYAALEVQRTATHDEIRVAWRRLARVWHPDRNPGDAKAETRFKSMSAAWHVLSDPERRNVYDEELDEQMLESELRRDAPKCRKCGAPSLPGFTLCVRCSLAERVRGSAKAHKDAKDPGPKPPHGAAKGPRAPKSTKAPPKKRRPPKTSPEQQRYEAEVEHLGNPDFYEDLIGHRRAEDYASGTGKYDGDSLLEALISEASIRSAFEGRPPSAGVSQRGSTIVFSDSEGSEVRLHVDPDALKDMSRNLRTADRLLRQIRRLFGGR